MNPEVKAKWLAALRSGEYQQTTGYLRVVEGEAKPVGYCCLGVLCEIASSEGVPLERSQRVVERHNGFFKVESFDYIEGSLPDRVIDWAGLHEEDPSVTVERDNTLSYFNDEGMSFTEIADLIEEQL